MSKVDNVYHARRLIQPMVDQVSVFEDCFADAVAKAAARILVNGMTRHTAYFLDLRPQPVLPSQCVIDRISRDIK